MQYQSFQLAKRGNQDADYEDAWAAAPEMQRFAIADGATESSFAALWAKLLAEAFVRAPACRPSQWLNWLPPVQERWTKAIGNQELPWYAEAKLQQGAFATFLGLVLSRPNAGKDNRWWAVAVGDCCLFQIRQHKLCRVFPITRSEAFSNRPGLVSSRMVVRSWLAKKWLVTRKGNWEAGDQIWLMTDALAKWFLGQQETGHNPGETVERVLKANTKENFTAWIEELRDKNTLRNDDVTLLAIRL